MEIVVTGRNVEVPDHFRVHVTDKVGRLERYDHKMMGMHVELFHEPNRRQLKTCQRVEITGRGGCGAVARAEATAKDFYAALDLAISKLEGRLRRSHDRRRVGGRRTRAMSGRGGTTITEELPDLMVEELPTGEIPIPTPRAHDEHLNGHHGEGDHDLADREIAEVEALAAAYNGDVDDPDGPAGEDALRARVRALAAHAGLVIALGGDNSITYAVTQGADASGLITLDAHFDLRDGISNGSPVRRLVEGGLDPRRIVQIGIADFANSVAYAQRAADLGIRVITLDELRRRGRADVVAEAREVAGAGGGGIHLDIDVDVCDRAVAPGCPASVPGGLQAWELRTLVRALAADARVRTADIVEVDATADAPDGRTVRLAALCVLELLAGVHARTTGGS